MNITEMTPAEIDAKLADLWEREAKLRHYIASDANIVGNERYWVGDRDAATARIAKHEAELNEIWVEKAPLETEYHVRGGWKRYFVVRNVGGHIHRGMDCTTCFDTTSFGWLPELSDCDEAEMVATYGEMACTVCFPDAPTMKGFGDGTSVLARYGAEEKAAREAEKAAKAAAKAEKAITAPDGSPLRGSYGIIKTKISAKRELSGAVNNYCFYGPTHPSDFLGLAKRIAEALDEAGLGEEIMGIVERAEKKARKELAVGGAREAHAFPREEL